MCPRAGRRPVAVWRRCTSSPEFPGGALLPHQPHRPQFTVLLDPLSLYARAYASGRAPQQARGTAAAILDAGTPEIRRISCRHAVVMNGFALGGRLERSRSPVFDCRGPIAQRRGAGNADRAALICSMGHLRRQLRSSGRNFWRGSQCRPTFLQLKTGAPFRPASERSMQECAALQAGIEGPWSPPSGYNRRRGGRH